MYLYTYMINTKTSERKKDKKKTREKKLKRIKNVNNVGILRADFMQEGARPNAWRPIGFGVKRKKCNIICVLDCSGEKKELRTGTLQERWFEKKN